MVKPEKFGNLHLVYHFTVPLRVIKQSSGIVPRKCWRRLNFPRAEILQVHKTLMIKYKNMSLDCGFHFWHILSIYYTNFEAVHCCQSCANMRRTWMTDFCCFNVYTRPSCTNRVLAEGPSSQKKGGALTFYTLQLNNF